MTDAIFKHTMLDGTVIRKCLLCNLFVDEQGNPDQDRYTARQYFYFMSIPQSLKCQHRRKTIYTVPLNCGQFVEVPFGTVVSFYDPNR